jgi:hypothetical protein
MPEYVEKDIKYLNKDFGQFRANLINFTKNYFPNTYNDFNESSPGMMFLEMASYVGDVLSYYTDYSLKETLLPYAQETENMLRLSQFYGVQTRNVASSVAKLDVFQTVPAIGTGTSARPDFRYALEIDENMIVSTNNATKFRTLDVVDFHQSGSNSGLDISVYSIDGSGNVDFYLLKKQVDVISGEQKTVTFTFGDPKIYDKIVLPDDNIIEIVSMTDDSGNRWREVPFLGQDTIFESIRNISYNDPELSANRSTAPYILKLTRTPYRFVSRLRDDGRVEIQFGAGISSGINEAIIPNPTNVGLALPVISRTTDTALDPSNFLYTDTYGLAPNNTTITITYTVGKGINDNVGANEITTVDSVTYLTTVDEVDATLLQNAKDSVAINNPTPATGGSNLPPVETLRQNIIGNFASQYRAVTKEDYIMRVYAMPAKYGSIEKAYIAPDSQLDTADREYPRDVVANQLGLDMYLLGFDANKNLVPVNNVVKENLRTYLSNYRILTDALSIKDAFIINIQIEFEIITRPDYNSNEVLLRCLSVLRDKFSNDRNQINGPISISNCMTDLDKVEGVQSVVEFEVKNVFDTNAGYSGNVYDIKAATRNNIIYPSLDPSIFEVKYPDTDIKGRVVKL